MLTFSNGNGEITIKLIIAEKPSLAKNIATSIGDMKRDDGAMCGGEYIIIKRAQDDWV